MSRFKKIGSFALLTALFSAANVLPAQNMERKIIVQGGNYYYTTIDPEFQIATLHVGKMSEPMSKARHFSLPAGRSLGEPVNPFSWDIYKDQVYLVNFLDHPMNDKNRALQRIALSALKEWNQPSLDSVSAVLMKSIQREPFALNDPYLFTIRRSPVLNNFFFDGIKADDSTYYLAVANNGEFCLWNFNGKEWQQGKMEQVALSGPFSLFVAAGKPYMVSDKGSVSQLSLSQKSLLTNALVKAGQAPSVLVINKDDHSVRYLPVNELKSNVEMQSIITTKSIPVF